MSIALAIGAHLSGRRLREERVDSESWQGAVEEGIGGGAGKWEQERGIKTSEEKEY